MQIWSDIACPWCYIGKRRFEKALDGFAHRDAVNVTWRSYQLDPSLPEHDHRAEAEYLSEVKGMPRAQVGEMLAHVAEQAAGEGLSYDFDSLVVANSRKAHRLLHAAKEADAADGGDRAHRLKEALLEGHFVSGKHIGDEDTLVALGTAVGLDESTARQALASEELDARVEQDIRDGHQIGVRGVPFFVFENKYGVSGAQPPELFAQALETVWSEKESSLITLDGGPGEACGPDGC